VIELVPLVQIALKTVTLVVVELSSGTKEDATMNVQQDQAPTQKMEPASLVSQVAIFVIFKTRLDVSDVLDPE
jgi:hypothetical protein